ncbi:hypothetical protein MUN77_01710 [Leucobacter allii]|uniref:hypothetical protein n=1 Tax=Leucobacter allii TaxID=2932247 RepID=UPI001FD01DC8|nr:hypothetical protein [Leucobacter allii]UOR02076.1 hypothetical protein MUN77_01710 [Leucobacter allii]
MSVKSERRAWYAANVEAKPAGEVAGSPAYQEWVARANAHMVRICKAGSAELLEPVEVAPVVESAPVASFGRRASAAAPSADDRAAYDAFVDGQLRAFGEFTDSPGGWSDDIWDQHAIARHRGGRTFEPFKGALKFARPYLNGDAIDALERGIIRWVTFAEFRLERAQIRAAEADAEDVERAAWESGSCALCLAEVCECAVIEWAA